MTCRFLLTGIAIVSLATTAAKSQAPSPTSDEQAPAQNITKDPDAQSRAARQQINGAAAVFSQGREVRSFDGSGNNRSNPQAGAAFTQLQRMSFADYADGVAAMAGATRKGPREISNMVAAQGALTIPNDFGTSDFLWQWGQFIDHDFSLGDGVPSADRSFDILIPTGDPFFDPLSVGGKTIRFDRAIFDPQTGNGPDNPRQHINEISSWLDGSMVFGSDEARAQALRTLDGTGRLKTSAGELLPLNENNLPNANGGASDPTKLFLAGDVRSNEQVGLAVMHILFVREHNRWADHFRKTRPWFSGDDIYEAARRMVAAEIQIITYDEFLPALIGADAIPPYNGYKPGEATLFTEFSGAAYRLGHSLINSTLLRLDSKGNEIPQGHLPLRDAFFNAPAVLRNRADIDPILRGLAAQRSQKIDGLIVDDLRNFLFGQPGAGGFDLASLNIQRGRDRGLPSYNDVRATLGVGRVADFDEISSDPAVQAALASAYGDVDNIDLWIGGISEDPLKSEGSQLGVTFRTILIHQFVALRDHDRFWYERDLTRPELAMVKNVRLSDIILKNTGIRPNEIQPDVFYVGRK